MGIRVECPNGHHFKVKDKYAGKRGLCPHCTGQVVVRVPAVEAEESGISGAAEAAYRQAVLNEHKASNAAPPPPGGSASVFDEPELKSDSSTSGSLLGSSVIRHGVKCKCGTSVPMWFARCPACGTYMEQR